MSKSPRIPSVIKADKPVSPETQNPSEARNNLQEQKKKKGLLSTFLGGNTEASGKLRRYLESADSSSSSVYNDVTNPTPKQRNGITMRS